MTTLARRFAVFSSLTIVGCALDLVTKAWVFQTVGPPQPHGPTLWLVEGYLGFQTTLNEGALFGMGAGNVVVFATLGILAAVGIPVWLFVAGAARDAWVNFALGLVMAGILGNLYDRLGLWWSDVYASYPPYAVRDWILCQYGDWRWPNFNIADCCLVVGAGMIFVQALMPSPQILVDTAPPKAA